MEKLLGLVEMTNQIEKLLCFLQSGKLERHPERSERVSFSYKEILRPDALVRTLNDETERHSEFIEESPDRDQEIPVSRLAGFRSHTFLKVRYTPQNVEKVLARHTRLDRLSQ